MRPLAQPCSHLIILVVMRWVIALSVIAGCGRFGFDPLDPNSGPPGSGVDGGGNSGSGNGSGNGSGSASKHYFSGGTYRSSTSPSSVTVMTGPLFATNMLLVVAVHWSNTTSSVTTVQDAFGNGFSMAGSMRRYNAKQSQVIWYKKVTAGTSINVYFDAPTPIVDLQWAVYAEIDQTSPTVATLSNSGTGTIASAGALMLSTNAVVVSFTQSQATDASAGPGFYERQKEGGGVLEDVDVGPGSITATATLNSSNDWIIHAVVLRPR